MNLYIRISNTNLCFVSHDGESDSSFEFVSYRVRPQVSLTMNLREAMAQVNMLRQKFDRVEVQVNGPITPVPLAEFQEEDVKTIHQYCFRPDENRRFFYDTVPALNVVFLFALSEATCRTIEETFGEVRYTSVLCPLVQHFAQKSINNPNGKRLYLYTHDDMIDVFVLENMQLLMLNSYSVRAISDVCYYTFNLVHQLGVDIQQTPLFVVGFPAKGNLVVSELQKYAHKIYSVNPAAEFNRNVIALTEGVPYDMMCALIK